MNEKGRRDCIEMILELLPIIKKDEAAQMNAKSIATKGAKRFVDYLLQK